MDEAPLPLIDDQHAASFDGTRSNKLARKAESARQARLRHKAYVTDLQEQVGALQARVRSLEPQCAPEQTAMHVVRELQSALSAEQHAQLTSWSVISPPTPSYLRPLRISRADGTDPLPRPTPRPLATRLTMSQGENHVLKRVAAGAAAAAAAAAAATAAAASQPIAIGNGPAEFGQRSASPMESDDDTFGMSRSWDDIEGARRRAPPPSPTPSFPRPHPAPARTRPAETHRFCAFRGATRSILYLNSPQNGFHPAHALPPGNFRLSSTAAASSAPSTFHISFGGTAS